MNAATRVGLMDLLALTPEDPLWVAEKSGWSCFVMGNDRCHYRRGSNSARLGSSAMTRPHDLPILYALCSDQGTVHGGEGAFGLMSARVRSGGSVMLYDTHYCHNEALSPDALGTLPAALHALKVGVNDCRRAGSRSTVMHRSCC